METAKRLRHLLRKVMGTALGWDYVLSNPVRGVKIRAKTLKRSHKFLTAGKRICVKGKITEYQGVPEIVADDPKQIALEPEK